MFMPTGTHLDFILATVRWLDDPQRVRWCAIFPEHQGHVHEAPYDELVIEAGGLGVGLRRDGKRAGYICPIIESGLDHDEAVAALAEWRHLLARHNNQQQHEQFLDDAI
ncbi:hypothetical protein PSMK_22720 [Phycisphaera mikurensis NBRC 102666]|uniref:Uncharacterized protein n=1 Tax=Phycisphaera mikurensis (strain NBRC 102666 / KCTC 22515 / FYK2301M01) TaxID=1142394 RepID=I0IGP3_PHYMF|nr:hypothetical protein PSMK_22720 [Phycisphaera mikurensis NBRC 102666]